jgi:periplasmic copper chaperone A
MLESSKSLTGSLFRSALFLLCATALAPALAADLEVKDAWVRGTVPAQKATGAFMQLLSKNGATVTGATSPVAAVVEVHEMSMDGGTMRMRPLPRLDVPAGKTVDLKPGGYHIMLMDLKQPLEVGQKVPITLQVEAGGKVEKLEVQAEVRSLTGAAAAMPMHPHPAQ